MAPYDDDDRSIGRPIQAPPVSPAPVQTSDTRGLAPAGGNPNGTSLQFEPRPDEGLGRPMQAAQGTATLTEEDHNRIKLERSREEELERRRVEELLASEAGLLRLPQFLAHPMAVSFMLGMAALLGLFVFTQVITTLAAMTALPDAWRYAGYLVLGILITGLAYAVGRCLVFYLRLRSNKPITLRGLEQLSQRTRIRWLVHEKKTEARQHLVEYLQSYPVDAAGEAKELQALGAPLVTAKPTGIVLMLKAR